MNDQTQDALRVKVAELSGCKRYRRPCDDRVFLCLEQPGTKECKWPVVLDSVDVVNSDVPLYPRDLNACAEFEKGLTGDQKEVYTQKLSEMCGNTHRAVLATAEQRCRAFVATMEGRK